MIDRVAEYLDRMQASCKNWRPVHVLDIEARGFDGRALIAHLQAKGDPVFYVFCAGCGERLCSLQASCNDQEPFKYYCGQCVGD